MEVTRTYAMKPTKKDISSLSPKQTLALAEGRKLGPLARKKRSREYLPVLRKVLFDPELLEEWKKGLIEAVRKPQYAVRFASILAKNAGPEGLFEIEVKRGVQTNQILINTGIDRSSPESHCEVVGEDDGDGQYIDAES